VNKKAWEEEKSLRAARYPVPRVKTETTAGGSQRAKKGLSPAFTARAFSQKVRGGV
jgi:hypothetical protein